MSFLVIYNGTEWLQDIGNRGGGAVYIERYAIFKGVGSNILQICYGRVKCPKNGQNCVKRN